MNSNIILPGLEETIITKTEVRGGQFIIHFEMPLKMHCCPRCGKETKRVHDYRITKIKHLKIMERMTTLFYRKRRYVCDCGKRFAEANPVVERFQRYSKEWNQMVQIRSIKAKTFKETAAQYGASVSTIIHRFDQIVPNTLKEKQSLPTAIAIDEFKGNADREKFQLIIADAVTKKPIEILPDRKQATIESYLREHGTNVKVVVMDMSRTFKAAVQKVLSKPVIVADHFHFVRYIYRALERTRIRVQQEWDDYDRKKVKKNALYF